MALREKESSTAIAGLPIYWGEADKSPILNWEKWIDLFEVALMAKNNISISELTKTTGTKEKSLMGDMEEGAATKKAIIILYLSQGMAARKNLLNKYPTTKIATISLTDLIKSCKECFGKPRNETLDRFKLLSHKQKEGETLRQFWSELNGLAAKCKFRGITESLFKNLFIVNMNNKEVQQKMCNEPKSTIEENIQFAFSYEEGIIRQQSFEKTAQPNIEILKFYLKNLIIMFMDQQSVLACVHHI